MRDSQGLRGGANYFQVAPARLGMDQPLQPRNYLVKLLLGGVPFTQESLFRRGDVTAESRGTHLNGYLQAAGLNHALGVEGDYVIFKGRRGAQRVHADGRDQSH